MDLDALADGYESEDRVAVDRVAAVGELEVDALQVFVNHQYVVALLQQFLGRVLELEVLGTFCRLVGVAEVEIVVTLFDVFLHHGVHVEFLFRHILVEIRVLLVSHLLDDARHGALVNLYLAVLESALQQFLGIESVLLLRFLQGESDLCLCLGCLHDVEPFSSRLLVALGDDFHLVARVQFLSEGYRLAVDLSAHAGVADARVDVVGEVEHRGSFREVQQVALRGEHINLVFLQVGGKLVHQLQVVVVFQGGTDVGKPFVNASFSLLDALVSPVCSQSVFGDIVHSFGSDLDFYPFLLRSQYGGVQTLVSVALRHAEPVAHTLWVRLIHICNQGEGLPALHIFLLSRCVDDDSDGKEVIYTFEGALLLLHLLPDGVDALGASLHVIFQSGSIEFLLDRLDEAGDIGITRSLGGIQLLLDHIVGIVLQILQAQVFQFALQLVETQLVGEWGIEVAGFLAHLVLCLLLVGITYLSHHVHAVGYHDEDYAHVF